MFFFQVCFTHIYFHTLGEQLYNYTSSISPVFNGSLSPLWSGDWNSKWPAPMKSPGMSFIRVQTYFVNVCIVGYQFRCNWYDYSTNKVSEIHSKDHSKMSYFRLKLLTKNKYFFIFPCLNSDNPYVNITSRDVCFKTTLLSVSIKKTFYQVWGSPS